MSPIRVSGPAVEPLTLAAAKQHLRLDGTDEDELVSALVVAGRLTVERTCRIALLEQTWRVRLKQWPEGRAVALPLHPVIGIESVRVVTGPGVPTALAPELWRLDGDADPVRLLVDAAAPEPAGRTAAVEIDVVCGYGATASAVPEPLRLAIRRLVAHWFEHRGDEGARAGPALPLDALALLAPYIRPRLA